MLIWGILFAIFALIEILIPALVSIWLAAAALIMVFVSLLVEDIKIQAMIFSVLSLFFILGLRRFCKAYIKPKERLRKEEVQISAICDSADGKGRYEVRYKGGIWSAYGEKGFDKGDIVYVDNFDGNKIILGKRV
ncbi:MAG: NfeD family protein [Johnsonella sp.]|nr:NfeD family protein [Johnsonella sp.]